MYLRWTMVTIVGPMDKYYLNGTILKHLQIIIKNTRMKKQGGSVRNKKWTEMVNKF